MDSIHWFSSIVLPYVNFLLFIGLVFFFGKKSAAESAKSRREKYLSVFEEAQKAKKAAEAALVELEKRLDHLPQEIALLEQRSSENSKKEVEKIVEAGASLVRHIKDEAANYAEAEADRAKQNLYCEVLKGVRSRVVDRILSELKDGQQLELVAKQLTVLKSSDNAKN